MCNVATDARSGTSRRDVLENAAPMLHPTLFVLS
jgi:hypothetical protein